MVPLDEILRLDSLSQHANSKKSKAMLVFFAFLYRCVFVDEESH